METRNATGRVAYPWEKCSIIADSEGWVLSSKDDRIVIAERGFHVPRVLLGIRIVRWFAHR